MSSHQSNWMNAISCVNIDTAVGITSAKIVVKGMKLDTPSGTVTFDLINALNDCYQKE
jgi:hypothetical protein